MQKNETVRLCMVASSGGHLEEIKQLKKLATAYFSVLVTEKQDYDIDFFGREVFYVKQLNRHQLRGLLEVVRLIPIAYRFLKKYKITHVITTGAMCSYPYCIAAKLAGAKLIYIESFARTESASLTGKLVYPFADCFIVQWESMLRVYPKAVYGGWIF